ncbi:MAG: DUF354 domain-containing protein, partial [archaeon]
MKVWVDISNAPQALFFRKFLEKHEDTLITARDFGAIEYILEGLDYKLVGAHGGKEKADKLIESGRRVVELAKIVKGYSPDVCVHKYSVEGARVAIGLGVRYIAVMDNEYARVQNLLTLPFADKVVCPAAIPDSEIRKYNARFEKFDGVCEVANIKNLKRSGAVLEELGLDRKGQIVVVRPEAYNASYSAGPGGAEKILQKIDDGVQKVVIARQPGEKYTGSNLFVARKPVDTLSLSYFADAVLSGGGSMSREAALMGTRSISFFPHRLAVDQYLVSKGLLERIDADKTGRISIKKTKKRKVPKM